MKKWKEVLIWFALSFILIVPYSLMQTFAETSLLPNWSFPLFVLITLILGWWGVFLGIKSLKNKKTEQKKKFILSFSYFVIAWSVVMTSDVLVYFLENNMLSKWYFLTIGGVYMFIGWISARLDSMLPKRK